MLFGALAVLKLLDLEGHAEALAAFPLVTPERARGGATLLAAVELCAAALLALAALAGRHARVAFEGGAALALGASLGYAILIVSAAYGERPLDEGVLFGIRASPRLPTSVLVGFVVVLLSWSAWLLSAALSLPREPAQRRRPWWRRLRPRSPSSGARVEA